MTDTTGIIIFRDDRSAEGTFQQLTPVCQQIKPVPDWQVTFFATYSRIASESGKVIPAYQVRARSSGDTFIVRLSEPLRYDELAAGIAKKFPHYQRVLVKMCP